MNGEWEWMGWMGIEFYLFIQMGMNNILVLLVWEIYPGPHTPGSYQFIPIRLLYVGVAMGAVKKGAHKMSVQANLGGGG